MENDTDMGDLLDPICVSSGAAGQIGALEKLATIHDRKGVNLNLFPYFLLS